MSLFNKIKSVFNSSSDDVPDAQTIYFKNGEMYKVYPTDKESWYDARYLFSDGVKYDLENLDDLKRIPVPKFPAHQNIMDGYGVTGNLDYVLRMKAGSFYNRKDKIRCSACLWKCTELMLAHPLSWEESHFYRIVQWHVEMGMFDEADKAAVGTTDIPVFVIPQAQSVADINNLIRLCGKVIGVNADDAVSKVTNVMNVAQMNSSSYSTRYKAYIDLGGETVGSGTFITELLHASGLENVCTGEGFCTMTDDEIIAANPEFIFTCGDVNDYLNNSAFADVAAVANNHVYSLEKKDIRYGSSNITNAVSIMNEAVSSIRGDE